MLKLRSADILGEIGATAFVPAVAADYSGSERLLRDVFGYQPVRGKTAPAPAVQEDQPGLTVKGGGN